MVVRLFFTLAISILMLSTNAQQVKWLTFEQAIELNKKEPRNIMIDMYTDWCGWCKVMDRETFSKPHIAKILNEQFYPVKFDAETKDTINFQGKAYINSGEGRRPPHQLAIGLLQGKMSYPSVVFINGQNQLLGAIPGFQKPEPMEAILDYISKELYLKKVDMGKHIEAFKKDTIK